MKNLKFFSNGRDSRRFVLIQWKLRKISAVKGKIANKSIKEKCEIICHIEKGMVNKEASKKFGVLKNSISIAQSNFRCTRQNLMKATMTVTTKQRPSRFFKNAALYSTTGDEMQSFRLKFSKQSLLRSKRT